jgi:adenylate kinase
VPADELVRRLSGRWVCRDHGHVYNETTNPPRVAGRCDLDDSPLIQRDDDRAETIRARLSIQLSSLADVVDYYESTGVLRHVDGVGDIDRVAEAVRGALDLAAEGAGPR